MQTWSPRQRATKKHSLVYMANSNLLSQKENRRIKKREGRSSERAVVMITEHKAGRLEERGEQQEDR